jgi:hypothetical protein
MGVLYYCDEEGRGTFIVLGTTMWVSYRELLSARVRTLTPISRQARAETEGLMASSDSTSSDPEFGLRVRTLTPISGPFSPPTISRVRSSDSGVRTLTPISREFGLRASSDSDPDLPLCFVAC